MLQDRYATHQTDPQDYLRPTIFGEADWARRELARTDRRKHD